MGLRWASGRSRASLAARGSTTPRSILPRVVPDGRARHGIAVPTEEVEDSAKSQSPEHGKFSMVLRCLAPLRVLAILFLIEFFAAQVYAASASVPGKQPRPKVKTTFDQTAYTLSYGQTLDACIKIVPEASGKAAITFGSDPQGVLSGRFGGAATCPDSTWDQIQIISATSLCTGSASLTVLLNSPTVKNKEINRVSATIILPTADVAQFFANHACSEISGGTGPGGAVDWTVTFNGPANQASGSFDGLTANETIAYRLGSGDDIRRRSWCSQATRPGHPRRRIAQRGTGHEIRLGNRRLAAPNRAWRGV